MAGELQETGDGGRELPVVYLCGPITGTSLRECKAWRREVAEALDGIARVLDPTRDSPDTTRRSAGPTTRGMTAERLLHGKHTVARNRFDLKRSDVVLACFLRAESISIGSVGEVFWADALGTPVIVVREEDNLHNHDMLNEVAAWVFTDLESAVRHLKTILTPGKPERSRRAAPRPR